MWDEIINLAIKNGLWAVLFMGLFIFVIKDSTSREKKYQETISNLTKHLEVINTIKEDIDDIKSVVYKDERTSKETVKKNDNNKDSQTK